MHKLNSYERHAQAELEKAGLPAFSGSHQARYLNPDHPYHIFWKTLQSRLLLEPDEKGELRRLINGVIGRAQKRYTKVRLFIAAFLSNHVHLMLQGPPQQIARFIAYIKREISSRWGKVIGWSGPMWGPYRATALITEMAQVRCFKYILSHGVKEKIVVRPEQWPGVQCAAKLLYGTPMTGTWLNGTKYGKALHKEKVKKKPRPVDKSKFIESEEVELCKLPAWEHLSDDVYRVRVQLLEDEIVDEGNVLRDGNPPVGIDFGASRLRRGEDPVLPWFEHRRCMIVWDDLNDADVQEYLRGHSAFQEAFRDASGRLLAGELGVDFPDHAFRPGLSPVLLAA